MSLECGDHNIDPTIHLWKCFIVAYDKEKERYIRGRIIQVFSNICEEVKMERNRQTVIGEVIALSISISTLPC